MKRTILASLALVLCSATTAFSAEEITVGGTGDSEKVLGLLAAAFEKQNPGTKVNVPPSIGSGGGIKAVSEGTIEIARIARPLEESEKKHELTVVTFAHSPVVFATHAGTKKAKSVTLAQVIGIYEGKIVNWKDLGGEDQKLYPIVRESGDSSTLVLKNNVPGFSGIQTLVGKVAYSTPEAVELATKHPHTIAYVPLGTVVGEKVKLLNVDGVKATEANVNNGKYKLVVPFLFAYKGEPKPLAKRFMDFVKSPKGKKILNENGVFPAK